MKHVPQVSTRGYYDLLTGKKLKNNSYYLYPAKYFANPSIPEVVIMVHGLRNNKQAAVAKFIIAKKRLRQLYYSYPIIGYSYDSNTKGAHIKKTALRALRIGQKIAEKNGIHLAQFILDFKKKNPRTKIHLMGHSLGSQVILSATRKISSKKNTKNIIESVHFFGASIVDGSMHPKKDGKHAQKVVHKKIKNYYCPTDEVLKEAEREGSVKLPIGLYGARGKTISKYSQKRVFPKNHRFANYAITLKSFP
jgi:pimeloyl-ACP methyl ester carboxylesterase